jgi:16S rRNA (guanine1207-N2)-methyltransferase
MIQCRIKGIDLTLETEPSLFSPNDIDRGTLAMLSCVKFKPDDKVLDLGCGYGVVGILAARLIGPERVVMVDNDPTALEIARRNAARNGVGDVPVILSDGFKNVGEKDFTLILSNPPYHADFSVPKSFIEKGFNRLVLGGRMVMVTKREKWYRNKLTAIFGGTAVVALNGYYVFTAEKRSFTYAVKKNKERGRK